MKLHRPSVLERNNGNLIKYRADLHEESLMKKCSNCGKELEEEVVKCTRCGEDIGRGKFKTTPWLFRRKKRITVTGDEFQSTPPITYIGCGLFLIIAIILIVYFIL